LLANPYISQGSQIYGKGFVFDDTDSASNPTALMREIILKHPDLGERIFPFLGGDEINSRSDHAAHRHVIYLSDVKDEAELSQFEPLTAIVREKVYPERMRLRDTSSGKQLKKKWRAYQAHRPKLYERAHKLERVIVTSLVSSHLSFVFVPAIAVFSHKLGIIPSSSASIFTCVQSRPHELWTRFLSAPIGDGVSYSPSDCFSTFPLPSSFEADAELEAAGETYHTQRAQLMSAYDLGMTETYNRFHARSENSTVIVALRTLHHQMDIAVLRAYGWNDLADRAAPEFIEQGADEGKAPKTRLDWPAEFKDEVLARLLALNAARAAEERAAGLTAADEEDDETDDDDDDAG